MGDMEFLHNPPPLEDRLLLSQVFAEAERHGMGNLVVGFVSAPGQKDRVAKYIEERVDYLADLRAS